MDRGCQVADLFNLNFHLFITVAHLPARAAQYVVLLISTRDFAWQSLLSVSLISGCFDTISLFLPTLIFSKTSGSIRPLSLQVFHFNRFTFQLDIFSHIVHAKNTNHLIYP